MQIELSQLANPFNIKGFQQSNGCAERTYWTSDYFRSAEICFPSNDGKKERLYVYVVGYSKFRSRYTG